MLVVKGLNVLTEFSMTLVSSNCRAKTAVLVLLKMTGVHCVL